jgi:hypothetical protein
MAFKKKSKDKGKAASTPTPMYPNPPQFGSRSDMPAYKPMERRSGSNMPTDAEQREEFKARKIKEFSGGNKEKTPDKLPGGSTLSRPARDYQ